MKTQSSRLDNGHIKSIPSLHFVGVGTEMVWGWCCGMCRRKTEIELLCVTLPVPICFASGRLTHGTHPPAPSLSRKRTGQGRCDFLRNVSSFKKQKSLLVPMQFNRDREGFRVGPLRSLEQSQPRFVNSKIHPNPSNRCIAFSIIACSGSFSGFALSQGGVRGAHSAPGYLLAPFQGFGYGSFRLAGCSCRLRNSIHDRDPGIGEPTNRILNPDSCRNPVSFAGHSARSLVLSHAPPIKNIGMSLRST